MARVALLLGAVLCERAFAHVLDRVAMRRTWLRGRDNVAKRYLIHVAGRNLALLIRALVGAGTHGHWGDLRLLWLIVNNRLLLVLLAAQITGSTGAGKTTPAALAVVTIAPDDGASAPGC
jgi:hypothetical protein